MVLVLAGVIGASTVHVIDNDPYARAGAPAAAASTTHVDGGEAERSKVPHFAKAMGHEEKRKLHNKCL